jgi:hypothetical protein
MRHRSAGATAHRPETGSSAHVGCDGRVNPKVLARRRPINDARVSHVGPTRTVHIREPHPESRWGGVPGALVARRGRKKFEGSEWETPRRCVGSYSRRQVFATTPRFASTSKSSSFHSPEGRKADARLRIGPVMVAPGTCPRPPTEAALPLSQFPVLIAVIRRVPLALRTLENIGGRAIAEGADECRQFQLAATPLARRHLRYIHVALTAEA